MTVQLQHMKATQALRIAVYGGSVLQLGMAVASLVLVAVFFGRLEHLMGGDEEYARLVLVGMLGADLLMLPAAVLGVLASRCREAVRRSEPRTVRVAHYKAVNEAALFVYAATLAAVLSLWVYTAKSETMLSWLLKTLLTLPSLLFQFFWARTCWLFYQMLSRHRGSDLVLPDEACIDDDGVREPLLPDDASVASEPHTRVTPVFAPAESFGPAGLTLPVKTPAPTAAATNGSATQGSGSLAARGAMGLGLVEDEDGESVLVDVGDGAPIADAQGSAKRSLSRRLYDTFVRSPSASLPSASITSALNTGASDATDRGTANGDAPPSSRGSGLAPRLDAPLVSQTSESSYATAASAATRGDSSAGPPSVASVTTVQTPRGGAAGRPPRPASSPAPQPSPAPSARSEAAAPPSGLARGFLVRKPAPSATAEPAPTPADSVAPAGSTSGDAPVPPVEAKPDTPPGAALPTDPDPATGTPSSVTNFMGMLRRNMSVTSSQKDTATPEPTMPSGLGSRFSSEGLARKSARAQDVWAARPSVERSGASMSRWAGSEGLADRGGEYDGAASSDDEGDTPRAATMPAAGGAQGVSSTAFSGALSGFAGRLFRPKAGQKSSSSS